MKKSQSIDIEKLRAYILEHRSANQIARLMKCGSIVIWEAVETRLPDLQDQLRSNGSRRRGGVNTMGV